MVIDQATGLDARIVNMRNHSPRVRADPSRIRLTDDAWLPPGLPHPGAGRRAGEERHRDRKGAGAAARRGRACARGRSVAEPVYGAPARWVAPALHEEAATMGLSVVTPTEVLATHLLEVVKPNFWRLFTLRALRMLLDAFLAPTDPKRAEANRRMLDELVPDKCRSTCCSRSCGSARGAGVDPQLAADSRGYRREQRAGGGAPGDLRARAPPSGVPALRRRPGAGRGAAADPAQPDVGGEF